MQQQLIPNTDAALSDGRQDDTPLLAVAERFRVMAEAAFEAIAITEHGRVIDVNPQFGEMFGYDLPEIIGTVVGRFIAPEDRCLVRQNNLAGVTHPYEAMAQRKDGTTFPTELFGRPMTYLGRPVRVTAIRDVSERKRAEEALRRAQEELEARVAIRTAELAQANASLQAEIVEREWTEVELQKVLAQSEQMLAAITSILIGVDQDGCITIWNTPPGGPSAWSATRCWASASPTAASPGTGRSCGEPSPSAGPRSGPRGPRTCAMCATARNGSWASPSTRSAATATCRWDFCCWPPTSPNASCWRVNSPRRRNWSPSASSPPASPTS